LLVVTIALAGALLGEEAARGQLVAQMQSLVGFDAARGMQGLIESAWRHPHGVLAGTLGAVALLIGAGGAFVQLRRALNTIGHVATLPVRTATLLHQRLRAFAWVLCFGFLAVASLLLSTVAASLAASLSDRFSGLPAVFALLDVLLSTAVLVVAFAALLRWLPDSAPSRRAVWCGATCSALLFAMGTHAVGLYLAHASMASSYGAAGSLVVVMLWVYCSAQILLYGAALAASLDESRMTVGTLAGARPLHVAPDHPAANTPVDAAPLTSLAAARSRLRPAMSVSRRRSPAAKSLAGPAVLLRFPDVRRERRE